MNVNQLLSKLSLEEKLAQLCAEGVPDAMMTDGRFDAAKAETLYPHGLFGLSVPIDLSPEALGAFVGEAAAHFCKCSPVPPVFICESLHGVLGMGTTVFPQSIGMGASFDPALMKRVASAIGREARALGIRLSLAPDLDLGREPRWGRIEETYGESSYLVEEMGAAYVEGILGEDGRYAATVKHFAAHGSPASGINMAPVAVTEQELFDRYLLPFRRALDAGAMCVMPAYSVLNGVPCHASRRLMQEILRDTMGFDGVVIADFGGIGLLNDFHRIAENTDEAGLLAFGVGVDVEAPKPLGYQNFKRLLDEGKLSERAVDEAVLRILRLKERLGLFDLPLPNAEEIRRTVRCDGHRALAREAAQKSIVLLKNEGMLPLKAGARIAVVGPNADSVQLGDYALPRFDAPTPFEAIRAHAEASGGSAVFAKGCEIYGSDTSGFAEAEVLAETADAVVCIIGGKSMKGYGVGWGSEEEGILTCGEGCDMHDLTPGGMQLDLVRRMNATGKPVCVVMIDGRPETLHDAGERCASLVAAFYPGEEGSVALARLLFGDVNFSAKLPVTFPRHVGQLPLCHDRLPSEGGYYKKPGTPDAPGRDYVFASPEPAYPFGFGMGYSELVYRELSVTDTGEGLSVRVTLENRGAMKADEPILVFVRDEYATVTQPMRRLCAIEKISLAPGEKKEATLTVPDGRLMFTDLSLCRRLEKGTFTVEVGGLRASVYMDREKRETEWMR